MKKWAIVILLVAGIIFFLTRTTKLNPIHVDGFTPVRDDSLADKYRPTVLCPEEFGAPVELYYRAARSGEKLYITYHFVWPGESNPAPGFLPWLNRTLYTGGLGLQKIVYGKGDIELVSLVILPDGRVDEVIYETAEDHHPTDFSVTHRTVHTAAQPPLVFRVIAWNHLFSLETAPSSALPTLHPEYFTEALWAEFEMVKERETVLKRSRAHMGYERESVKSE